MFQVKIKNSKMHALVNPFFELWRLEEVVPYAVIPVIMLYSMGHMIEVV